MLNLKLFADVKSAVGGSCYFLQMNTANNENLDSLPVFKE